jgi:hypothetical protein
MKLGPILCDEISFSFPGDPGGYCIGRRVDMPGC